MSLPWCKNFGHQAGLAVAWYACERTSRSLHAVVGLVARPSTRLDTLADDSCLAQQPVALNSHPRVKGGPARRAGALREPMSSD